MALIKYAVDYRYPGERASKRQATAALRCIDDLRTVARHVFGIRSGRKGRKKGP
jgi:hypothetical protein